MAESNGPLPRLNAYGVLFVASLLAAVGLAIVDGFGTGPAILVVIAFLVAVVAMYRTDSETEAAPGEERDEDDGEDLDKKAQGMVGGGVDTSL
ncbi:hypothetical protein [Halopiger goleimassiliensis]|uniref:hypothetical protein n=1 Tax=Halopiger goleimassiliensis TaxID=1293048 RepID=UPI000677EE75|nr:hypothetical protein [Halopiger goleimassiliensis]